jgi:hypothetical protein
MNWDTIASVATAIGVCIAAWQIWESKKLARTSFEDGLDQQYRNLAMDIPVDALIGKPVDDESGKLREIIYNYLDLCNEQIYLRKIKRISKNRWKDWNIGIKDNLSKPAFKVVWDEIKETAPNTFTALESLEKNKFEIDPAHCKNDCA